MLKQNFALNYLKEFLSDHNVSLKKGTESAPPFPSNVSPASRPPGVTIGLKNCKMEGQSTSRNPETYILSVQRFRIICAEN